jgi:hypothetical protein
MPFDPKKTRAICGPGMLREFQFRKYLIHAVMSNNLMREIAARSWQRCAGARGRGSRGRRWCFEQGKTNGKTNGVRVDFFRQLYRAIGTAAVEGGKN